MGETLRLVPRAEIEAAVMSKKCEDEILQLVARVQELVKSGFEITRPLAEQVVSGEITDQREIDRIMDNLLSYIEYPPAKQMFFRCCDAIRKNAPDIADEYMEIYKNYFADGSAVTD